MRRNDKEIIDKEELEEILQSGTFCSLALSDGNIPYIVTLNYGYHDNALYFHSANEGRKIDILRKNISVSFQVIDSVKPVSGETACSHTTVYRSVSGFGKAEFFSSAEEKTRALGYIMKQVTGNDQWEIPENSIEKIAVIKVDIISLTGKKSG